MAWAVLYTPYLLGLSDDLGVAVNALLAHRCLGRDRGACRPDAAHDVRGPFEILVRRVTYGSMAR